MPTLKVISGPLAGRSLSLDRELVVGRDEADLTIDDPEISRRHAVIRPVEGGVQVEDLGSSNGTLVDGRRIDAPTVLQPDDSLYLGTTTLKLVELPAEAPSGVARVAASAVGRAPLRRLHKRIGISEG